MKISVELDVFSGRPNPAWEVEKEEAKNIGNLLQNLPSVEAPVPDGGLGYRGFTLILDDGDKIKTVHIYANMIWADDDSSKVFIDENHVEQILLQMAKENGYGDILKSLGME